MAHASGIEESNAEIVAGDVKADTITVKIKDQNGTTAFKIKTNVVMKKLFSAYLQQTGQEASAVRFLFDGERVNDTDTPEKLALQDNDQIDVMVQQIGGWCI